MPQDNESQIAEMQHRIANLEHANEKVMDLIGDLLHMFKVICRNDRSLFIDHGNKRRKQ